MTSPAPEAPPQAAPSPIVEAPPAAPAPGFKDRLKAKLPSKRKLIMGAIAAAVVVGGYEGYKIFTTEGTDDAFVTGHIHPISARVSGTVVQVLVDDNQQVKKGDPLVQLDKNDYETTLTIRQAEQARSNSNLIRFGKQTRFQPLVQIDYDNSVAQKAVAESNLKQAQLNLDYTTVRAPADGYVGKRTVELGQIVQPGQALMAVVSNDVWIVANFKESQLAHMKRGQKVRIEVDAVPQRDFEGKVDSVASATGASFSLLPPDNATGNFTKVVQRVPVKIVFDKESVRGYEDRIRQGLSAVVSVKVR